MKQYDNRGNPTYARDDAGFIVVNFYHKVPKMLKPFIFPNQATQVFWSEEVRKPGWKVVLVKEACSTKHQQSTIDVFITTKKEATGIHSVNHVPPPPTTASLVGAIELSNSDNSLALAKFLVFVITNAWYMVQM